MGCRPKPPCPPVWKPKKPCGHPWPKGKNIKFVCAPVCAPVVSVVVNCPPAPPCPPCPPTPPVEGACCPCGNLLENGGFDLPSVGADDLPFWQETADVERTDNPVHAGQIIGGVQRFGAAEIPDDNEICQAVPVETGCCYVLNFAAQRTGGTDPGIARIDIYSTANPATFDCLGTTQTPLQSFNLLVPKSAASGFESFTLVADVTATPAAGQSLVACVCFEYPETQGQAGTFFVDSVNFYPSGGPCAADN